MDYTAAGSAEGGEREEPQFDSDGDEVLAVTSPTRSADANIQSLFSPTVSALGGSGSYSPSATSATSNGSATSPLPDGPATLAKEVANEGEHEAHTSATIGTTSLPASEVPAGDATPALPAKRKRATVAGIPTWTDEEETRLLASIGRYTGPPENAIDIASLSVPAASNTAAWTTIKQLFDEAAVSTSIKPTSRSALAIANRFRRMKTRNADTPHAAQSAQVSTRSRTTPKSSEEWTGGTVPRRRRVPGRFSGWFDEPTAGESRKRAGAPIAPPGRAASASDSCDLPIPPASEPASPYSSLPGRHSVPGQESQVSVAVAPTLTIGVQSEGLDPASASQALTASSGTSAYRSGSKWTASQDAELLQLDRQGFSVLRIAAETGRTESSIQQRLTRVRKQAAQTSQSGAAISASSGGLGSSSLVTGPFEPLGGRASDAPSEAPRVKTRKHPEPFSQEEDQKLAELRAAGQSFNAIASQLQRASQTCSQRYRRLQKDAASARGPPVAATSLFAPLQLLAPAALPASTLHAPIGTASSVAVPPAAVAPFPNLSAQQQQQDAGPARGPSFPQPDPQLFQLQLQLPSGPAALPWQQQQQQALPLPPYSPQEEATLFRLHLQNSTVDVIAQTLGRSVKSVERRFGKKRDVWIAQGLLERGSKLRRAVMEIATPPSQPASTRLSASGPVSLSATPALYMPASSTEPAQHAVALPPRFALPPSGGRSGGLPTYSPPLLDKSPCTPSACTSEPDSTSTTTPATGFFEAGSRFESGLRALGRFRDLVARAAEESRVGDVHDAGADVRVSGITQVDGMVVL